MDTKDYKDQVMEAARETVGTPEAMEVLDRLGGGAAEAQINALASQTVESPQQLALELAASIQDGIDEANKIKSEDLTGDVSPPPNAGRFSESYKVAFQQQLDARRVQQPLAGVAEAAINPLGGILAAFAAVKPASSEDVFVAPGDTPYVAKTASQLAVDARKDQEFARELGVPPKKS